SARMAQGNVDLLMIGDSITHGWEGKGKDVWQKYYGTRNAMNFGIGGDRTEPVLWRLAHSPLDKINPKMAVVLIGTNNIGRPDRSTPNHTIEGVKKVVAVLKEKFPKMKILLLEVFPRDEQPDSPRRVKVNQINAGLRKAFVHVENVQLYSIGELFCDKNGVLRHDLMPDFLHPNAEGYEIWARAMEPMIAQAVDKVPGECIPVDKSGSYRETWYKIYNAQNELLKKGNVEILLLGDSITNRWDTMGKAQWKKYLEGHKAVNLGIGGDTTQNVLWRIDHYDFSKTTPKKAFLLIGVNNTSSETRAENIVLATRQIIQRLQEKFPGIHVYVMKQFPNRRGDKWTPERTAKVKMLNELLPYYVRDLKGVTMLDFDSAFRLKDGSVPAEYMPDGLHLGVPGFEIWGKCLQPYLSTAP
ncbi:MAG: GDSL-type esterase/lipase family protein, partial [Thermoguttaceae bacterium]|nr:GDSL-type esterase/lipase family protein [Thermoguttaceae bacterium]